MILIEEGEILTLKNKEYIVVNLIDYNNSKYAYLVSNFTPLEIVITRVISINGNSILEEVNDENTLKEILKLVS